MPPGSGLFAMMQAALLERPGHFGIVDEPVPEPGWGEILVRTSVCGICTSEVDMFEGHNPSLEYPRFIGHEVSGTIAGVGPGVGGFSEGDHVAVYAEGRGYAEYIVVPAAWAVKMKPDTPFDLALGEPIACSVNGVRKADPEIGDSVAIVGCGFMGLIMMQVFRACGVGDIIAIDRRESVLALAHVLGATHLVNGADVDPVDAVKEITGGRGVDIGVEAAGSQGSLDLTSQIVRMEGKLEIFGFHQGTPRSVDWGWWNWMAFQVVNAHTRTQSVYVDGMRIGIEMMERGTLDMRSLVTHRFGLDDINLGFETAAGKAEGFVKGVIAFD